VATGAFYQHYKGGCYRLLCVAKNEADGRPLAIYQSLSTGQIWARPASNFFEKVQPPGYPAPVPRFAKLTDDPRKKEETDNELKTIPATVEGEVVRRDPGVLPAGHERPERDGGSAGS
jgi:hypothetical protein